MEHIGDVRVVAVLAFFFQVELTVREQTLFLEVRHELHRVLQDGAEMADLRLRRIHVERVGVQLHVQIGPRQIAAILTRVALLIYSAARIHFADNADIRSRLQLERTRTRRC